MSNHEDRKHAKYGGSTIHRSRRCPAWARLAKNIRRSFGNGEAATEGTKVHQLLELSLLQGLEAAQAHPDWSEDRQEGFIHAYNYVESLRAEFDDLQVFPEQEVYFPQKVVAREDCGGSADIVCISLKAARGWIVDYKNGMKNVPSPDVNDQVWFYGTAAFWDSALETVTFVIIQPNSPGEDIEEHTASVLDLLAFRADIENVLLRCEASDAILVPGSWCTYCAIGTECSARERHAIEVLTGKEGPISYLLIDELEKPEELDVIRWGEINAKAAFVKAWLSDIHKASLEFAKNGGTIPFNKLVEAKAMRRWIGTAEETASGLADITGIEASKFLKTKAIGITEAETVIRKVAKDSVNPDGVRNKFAQLSLKLSSGNLSLVPEDDSRPAYNPAKSVYGGLKLGSVT